MRAFEEHAMSSFITSALELLNQNQGVVSVAIFVLTLFLGWVTGIFEALRRKPKLRLGLIPGPTFCTTFYTGEKRDGRDVHRTAIALYLRVANVGNAATSIENVALGYHWNLRPYSWLWFRYRIFWDWIEHPLITLTDFHVTLPEGSIKTYPSLFQGSAMLGKQTDTYLEAGKIVSGVVYFELDESWGGHAPAPRAGRTRLKVAVRDAFGTKTRRPFGFQL